ncbi:hypothetical protein [Longispora albida]|uniref:hypothetical protein n=1 Tax=Longispora albida TaxID=203523 RepID=UPI0003A04DE6|nr:hypothetical protein [Longispora albida]
MMYGYGPGMGWMLVMSLLWAGLLAAAVWTVVRLAGPGTPGRRREETPAEILDRRLAAGEIDPQSYDDIRTRIGH